MFTEPLVTFTFISWFIYLRVRNAEMIECAARGSDTGTRARAEINLVI